MNEIEITPLEVYGRNFIPPEYLPAGCDEHYLRIVQANLLPEDFRPLTRDEVLALEANGNTSENWSTVLAAEPLFIEQVRGCHFAGLVRLGHVKPMCLSCDGLELPVGLYNSRIVACDIGQNCAIHDVGLLAHMIVRDNVMLHRVDAMFTTPAATFGHGIVKQGQTETHRLRLALMNENGGRAVSPFAGMRAADAFLWAKFRDDETLLARLAEMTQKTLDTRWGLYGHVGQRCVIRGTRSIRDAMIGPGAVIDGANRIENVTIDSSPDEPTRIGAGCELVDGIVSLGCRVSGGARARRFVLAQCSTLADGARLTDSYLGDNSTVAGAEVSCSLVFPAHEQHHSNSFLIAALVGGQSNLAAGATIGSNHNSRSPDGELVAERGFWPALCVSLKHNCRFAAYTLLANGDYACELNLPLPFCLVSQDLDGSRLLLRPAYWWLYNMYALARNAWKFPARDRRRHKAQAVEYDFLAPDTAEEMLAAISLLELWTARAALRYRTGSSHDKSEAELAMIGRKMLSDPGNRDWPQIEVLAEGVENSRRPVIVLKPAEAWQAYRDMLNFYAAGELLKWRKAHAGSSLEDLAAELAGPRVAKWLNVGGQIVSMDDLAGLRERIGDAQVNTWPLVHQEWDRLAAQAPLARQRHALSVLLALHGAAALSTDIWHDALGRAVATARYMAEQTHLTRQKDYDNLFRQAVYDSPAEQEAVVGRPDDNDFVRHMQRQADDFASAAERAQ